LNFQRLNILTIGLVLILVPAIVLHFVPWWSLLVVFAVYSIVLGWGVFDIGSQFFMKTYWKGERGKVAFTFDDGPDPEVTPKILDVLKEASVKAAFFTITKNAQENPELLQRIDREGHVIGNHTYSHNYVFSFESAEQELMKGHQAIEQILGKAPRYFRPPFGVMNPKIAKAARMLNYAVIGWDLRSQDGRIRTKEATVNRVKKHLKKSSIILFHDTNPTTPDAVREVIHLCRESGMEIVPLPELINVKPYQN
jgi:peptidoglycan/xylan/chitin deacetylase (PgdA/CDA1 family)